MAQSGTVWVDTRADTTGIARDLARFATGGGSKGLQALTLLATGAAAGIGALGVASVRASTEFNKSMSSVQAVSNATSADFAALSEAALQAGADTVFSATESAQAEAELAKAGISTADILGGALAGSLDLAAAGQLGLTEAATVTAQALNVFGLAGDQTSRVADVLAAGAVKSAADVSQLGQALQQGGLVAKQTGLDLEDTVGVLALFADNALVGSDAGTSLKTALQRLTPQSQEAAGAMEALGLSFFDSQGNFVGIAETAQRLQNALGGLSTEQRQTALTTIFGADAIRSASLLYEAGAAGVNEYTQAVNDQGAAQRVASQQLDNLAGDLEQLQGSFETVLIGLGSSADSGLRDIVQQATEFVNGLGEALDSAEFDAFSEKVAAALSGVGGALADAASGVAGFVGSIDGADIAALVDALGSLADAAGSIVGAGFSVMASALSIALDVAGALAPAVTTLSGALEVLADNSFVVTAAISAFAAVRLVSVISPMVGSVAQLGQSFTYLNQQIGSIAATQGVSKLTALRGVLGSSTSGLTGAISGANAAAVVLTATIAGSLSVYQNWASDQREVEEATKALTTALLEQNDVSANMRLARLFTDALDAQEGVADAFARTGIAVSAVTSAVNQNAGETADVFGKLRAAAEAGAPAAALQRTLDTYTDLTPAVRSLAEQLIAAAGAGSFQGSELIKLTRILEGQAIAAGGSAAALQVQAQRFREEAEGATLSADAQRDLSVALNDNASLEARRQALVALKDAYPELAEAAGIAAAETDSVGRASSTASGGVDALGGSATDTAGALELMGGAAGTALDGLLGLMDAQDGLEDAQLRVNDAQEKLQEILSGNTEGVRNAREALSEAVDALADARADTGPGSKASRDAARDLRDARKALRDAQIEAGKEPEEGDFFEDRRDAVIDALERLGEAEQKLAQINSGVSDQVTSAQERVADAQARLGDELAKTGPKSREARDAQEELDDAQRNVMSSAQGVSTALGTLSAESIPAAIAQIQALGDQHLITKAQVDQMIASLLIEAGLINTINTTPIAPPTATTGPAVRPGRNNADSGEYSPNGQTVLSEAVGKQRGLGFAPYDTTANDGSEWKWDAKQKVWRKVGPGRAAGGPVWGGTMFPVNELGRPELYTDRSGDQYLMPSNRGGQVTPLDASNADVVAEIRSLSALLVSTVRDVMRTTANGGEPLAPILRGIEENTRHQEANRTAADSRSRVLELV